MFILPGMVVVTLGCVAVLFRGVVLTPGCEVEAPSCLLVFPGGVLLAGGVVGFPVYVLVLMEAFVERLRGLGFPDPHQVLQRSEETHAASQDLSIQVGWAVVAMEWVEPLSSAVLASLRTSISSRSSIRCPLLSTIQSLCSLRDWITFLLLDTSSWSCRVVDTRSSFCISIKWCLLFSLELCSSRVSLSSL